jgi:hypothetical protein
MSDPSPKIPLPRVQAYLSKVIWWHVGHDTVFLRSMRAFVKWFFDIVRNALIAGGLKYLATKTDSLLLKLLSEAASFALFAYCLSYVQTWQLRLLHPWWPSNWARVGDIIISLAIIGPLFYIIIQTIPVAIDEIAKAQVK